jgi:hypothetical protein
VLERIGAHPDAFSGIKAAVTKSAHDLVVKQLKTKTTTLQDMRSVRDALGINQFDLILDGMNEPTVKSILSRLDKHHPNLKSADARWRRVQLRTLCEGGAEPSEKVKVGKKKAPGRSQTPVARVNNPSGFGTEAMDVFRQSVRKKSPPTR